MNFDRKRFFDNYRKEFGSLNQSVVDALEFLLNGFETTPEWKDINEISYALSTIKHETAHTFLPITEYGGASYFKKYDGRADLGNNQPGDGARFKGRGFVQITGRKNYTRFAKLLGIDIVKNPEDTLRPGAAFQIMTLGMHKGYFTGKKLSDYITPSKVDYRNARRIINGTDKAATLATYAKKFETILRNSLSTDKPIKPAEAISSSPKEIPAEASNNSVEAPDSVLSSGETEAAQTSTQTQKIETGNASVEVQTGTINEQDVTEEAPVTEPEPQGFIKKLGAGVTSLVGGTILYDSLGKFSGVQLSTQAIYVLMFIVLIAFLGFCVWAILDTWKKNKKTEIEALANTSVNRKNIKWVKPE
jgi:putative chitinase